MKSENESDSHPPIDVIDPIRERIQAVCDLAEAVKYVAKALCDTAPTVNISNCVVHGGDGPAIKVGGKR